MDITTLMFGGVAVVIIIALIKGARIVPQREQFVVERLGKYSRTLDAGFHILVPFIDRVSYKHSLKEEALDVPKQSCITRDNITVAVDGIIYLQVIDSKNASYGITNYRYAVAQLAQTTLRSEIGKLELDKTFEARESINASVVGAIDKAGVSWGIKVLRYEIKDIIPPSSIQETLEKQMTAERERRALVAISEGEKQAQINRSEGFKQEKVNISEAEKIRQINEAEGKAKEIELLAEATANSLTMVGAAINNSGGAEAMRLRITEQYIREFGQIAKQSTNLVIPANVSDIASIIAIASKASKRDV
jgi:regulator of protease activity HflC (stomatin/prohibitin superfamily)